VSTVRADQVVAAARAQQQSLVMEKSRLDAQANRHAEDLRGLNQEWAHAWQYLGEVLVPTLAAPTLDAAAQLLQLPPLSASSIAAAMGAERARLQGEIDTVERDPLFRDSDVVLNECSIHLAELESSIGALAPAVAEFLGLLYWDELIATGYGTDAYPGKWWALSYYRHWKHADLAVEELGPKYQVQDFAALRAYYERDSEALHALQVSQAEWQAKQQAVEFLQQQHQKASDELRSLEVRTLTAARARAVQHLAALSLDQALQQVSGFPPAVVAVKRLMGLHAKIEYLSKMYAEWVAKPLAQIETMIAKNERDIHKLRTPKHAHRVFSSDDFARRFRDRESSWLKRRHNYDTARSRIVAFDDYDRYDPTTEVIWWSLMTDDCVKARYIPEVDAYYSSGARHRHDDAVASVADEIVDPTTVAADDIS